MWVQKLQRSKTLKVFLVLVVLLASFTATTTKAVGLDTAVKIVAGSSAQQVVRSIGEKAGMKFTKESLDATTDYINGQAAKGNVTYIDFAKKANTVATTGTPDPVKPGWKKYLLDPVLWLTGADLLVEAYDAFNDARLGGTQVEVYGKQYENNGFYTKLVDVLEGGYQRKYLEYHHQHLKNGYLWRQMVTAEFKSYQPQFTIKTKTSTSVTVVFALDIETNSGQVFKPYATSEQTLFIPDIDVNYNSDEGLYSRPADDDDDADISNVTNYDTYKKTIDNDDYSKVTYDNDIEIYAPDTTNTTEYNNYTTPWNTKLDDETYNIIVKPITDIDIVVPPDDDDDLPTGPRPDPVEVIDRSMLDVARQSYDYLGDSVDTAIASMRDVTDNVTGLIAFLDDTFDWLPAEWRALFGSAFILGVFAHFFRR